MSCAHVQFEAEVILPLLAAPGAGSSHDGTGGIGRANFGGAIIGIIGVSRIIGVDIAGENRSLAI